MDFKQFLLRYEYTVVHIFGYEVAIHLEEFILIFMGIFIGIVIEALINGNFIHKLYGVEDFGKSKVQMVRINKDGKTRYIIGFKTLAEAFMQVLLLGFSPLFTYKQFTKRDERRTKRFLIVLGVIMLLTIFLAILSICTVFQPI